EHDGCRLTALENKEQSSTEKGNDSPGILGSSAAARSICWRAVRHEKPDDVIQQASGNSVKV
ncbi:hypothetical protein DNTS_025879, partial [Danionella cerebrum]